MKRTYIFAALLAGAAFFQGCSLFKSFTPDPNAVAYFTGTNIPLPEFEKAYAKNVGNVAKTSTDSLKQYENFLDLYVNFKMKLADAEERGYAKDKDLNAELLDYKKKIGVTYVLEKQLVDPNVRRLYDLRKFEYRVSHLMIRPDSTGEEGARALAAALLDSIGNHGKSFEQLTMAYSQDHFSKSSGGDIYYLTAGMLMPEFEEAYLATPVGGVYPNVVQTRYGFHIIKVTEKRERKPSIRASHILIDFLNEKNEVDSASAKKRVDSVYKALGSGADFAELAKKYSEDQGSKDNGGDLNFFERRMMMKEFDEAAFNLALNEISPVISTTYGYHIIKLTDVKPYPAYDEEKENLKTMYRQQRYNVDYDTLTNGLKAKFSYTVDQGVLKEFAMKGDSAKIASEIRTSPWYTALAPRTLFSLAGTKVALDSFVTYMIASSEFNGRVITQKFAEEALKKYSSEQALEAQALQLDKSNTEFASLMEDYRNGIYIFKLQEEEVWNRIALDSIRLEKHYLKTKDKYVWPDRVEFGEIFTRSDSILQVVQDKLKAGEDFDSVAAAYTERPGFKEKAGRFALGDVKSSQLSEEADKLQSPGTVSAAFENSGGKSIIKLYQRVPAGLKTFEEAKAEVSGSFQDEESKRLEKDYIDRLTKRYNPQKNADVLRRAFKN